MATQELLEVKVNGGSLSAPDELHRRKLEALAEFVDALLPVAGGNVAKMVLYGSVARGEADDDSDIDVLVFVLGDAAAEQQRISEQAWELSLRTDEHVSAMVFPLYQYEHPDSFFFASSLRYGTEIYTMDDKELRRKAARDNYLLALDYLEAAEIVRAAGKVRAAIDNAYNAAELAAKAFLAFEIDHIPTRHGRVVGKFSEIFIVKHQLIPPQVGRSLNTLLDRRHTARYVWPADLTDDMAAAAVDLARDLVERLRRYIADTIPESDEQEDDS